jgi:hypothetical protein
MSLSVITSTLPGNSNRETNSDDLEGIQQFENPVPSLPTKNVALRPQTSMGDLTINQPRSGCNGPGTNNPGFRERLITTPLIPHLDGLDGKSIPGIASLPSEICVDNDVQSVNFHIQPLIVVNQDQTSTLDTSLQKLSQLDLYLPKNLGHSPGMDSDNNSSGDTNITTWLHPTVPDNSTLPISFEKQGRGSTSGNSGCTVFVAQATGMIMTLESQSTNKFDKLHAQTTPVIMPPLENPQIVVNDVHRINGSGEDSNKSGQRNIGYPRLADPTNHITPLPAQPTFLILKQVIWTHTSQKY